MDPVLKCGRLQLYPAPAPAPAPAQLPTTIYSAVSYLQNNTHGNSRFVSGLAVAIPHKYNVGAFTYISGAECV